MWTLLTFHNNNTTEILTTLKLLQNEVVKLFIGDIREYFSTKAVIYFDNNRIINKEEGLHDNLLSALSKAEKELITEHRSNQLFPTIHYHWFHEDGKNIIAIDTNEPKIINLFHNKQFTVFKENVRMFSGREKDLNFFSMGGTLFDLSQINFAKNWVDFIPTFEKRCLLQVEYIISKHLKKQGIAITKDAILNYEKYNDLLNKITLIMPTIERDLITNWEDTPENIVEKIHKKRLK